MQLSISQIHKGMHVRINGERTPTKIINDPKVCPTQPEFFHINGGCYDARFTSFEARP